MLGGIVAYIRLVFLFPDLCFQFQNLIFQGLDYSFYIFFLVLFQISIWVWSPSKWMFFFLWVLSNSITQSSCAQTSMIGRLRYLKLFLRYWMLKRTHLLLHLFLFFLVHFFDLLKVMLELLLLLFQFFSMSLLHLFNLLKILCLEFVLWLHI